MSSILNYIRLDKLWREVINSIPITSNVEEFFLIKFIIQKQEKFPIINKYSYIYGYNFPLDPRYPETGKIDLMLADGNNHFLAIKVKFFGKISADTEEKKRKKERNELGKQAATFANKFKAAHPDHIVDSLEISDESFELEYKDFYLDYKNFVDAEWKKVLDLYKEF
ncbi:MAG: hypothetical protein ACFFCM_06745 [Promethearchaeota archaeon]